MEYKFFETEEAGLKLQWEAFTLRGYFKEESGTAKNIRREIGYLYTPNVVGYPIHSVGIYGRSTKRIVHGLGERADFRFKIHEWEPNCTAPGNTVVVFDEFIECVADPKAFLVDLEMDDAVAFIVAAIPAWETDDHHDKSHLWAWTETSFAELFIKAGWTVDKDYVIDSHRYLVASRALRTPETVFNVQNKVKKALMSLDGSKTGRPSGGRFLTILEIGGSEVVEFFAKGHICFAQVNDPEMAIAAARRRPELTVSTKPFNLDADIIIEGDKVHVKEQLIPIPPK